MQSKSAEDVVKDARSISGSGWGVRGDDQAHFDHVHMEGKYDTSSRNVSPRENWVEQEDANDDFFRAVRNALERRGMTLDKASEVARGTIRRWATGGGDVKADTRAKAVASMAQWEAARVRAKARPNKGEGKMHDAMPGSFEALRDALRIAAQERFGKQPTGADAGYSKGEEPECYVGIEATYPDHLIVSIENYRQSGESRKTYRVPYTVAADGTPKLGKQEEVTLTVVASSAGEDRPATADEAAAVRFAVPAAAGINEAVSLLMVGGIEGKSAEVVRPAALRLLDALALKGMPLYDYAEKDAYDEDDDEDPPTPEEERPVGDSVVLRDPDDPDAEAEGAGEAVIDDVDALLAEREEGAQVPDEEDEELEGKGLVVVDADEIAAELAELGLVA